MRNSIYSILLFGLVVSWPLLSVQKYEAFNLSEILQAEQEVEEGYSGSIRPIQMNEKGDVVGQMISSGESGKIFHLFYFKDENTLLVKPIPNKLKNVVLNNGGMIAGNIKGESAPFIWDTERDTFEPVTSWDECTKYIGLGVVNFTPKMHDIGEDGELLLSCTQRNISNARDIYNNFGENFKSRSKFWTFLKKIGDSSGDVVFGDQYAYLVKDGEVEPIEAPFSKVRTLREQWEVMGSFTYRNEEGTNVRTIQFINRTIGIPYLLYYPLNAHIIDTNHSGDVLALSKEKDPTLYLWKVPIGEQGDKIEAIFINQRGVQEAKLNDAGVVFFRNPEGSFRLQEGRRDKIEAYDNGLVVTIREIIDVNKNGEILIKGFMPEDDFYPISYWILKPVGD